MITVAQISAEKKILAVTIYKLIESSGLKPVGFIDGTTRKHRAYDRLEIEKIIIKRGKGKRGKGKKNEN